MEYTKGEWKLTDQEIAQIEESGGNVGEAQERKKRAYIKAGGIILNPDALPDLYEALKEARAYITSITAIQYPKLCEDTLEVIRQALAKAR